MSPMEILGLPMGENDADAATVRDYLKELLTRVWEEGEGFSGKRPFGNSGWEAELYLPLVRAGAVKGRIDDDGYLGYGEFDKKTADELIFEAIAALQ